MFVALGGTETFGFRAGASKTWAQTFYATKLPLGSVFVNVARPEATVAQARRNQLPLALSQHPSLAVVWLGPGDQAAGTSATSFGEDLTGLLSGLRRSGTAQVLVGSPEPNTPGSTYTDQIAAAARDTGAAVVPLPASTSSEESTPRGPAGVGHRGIRRVRRLPAPLTTSRQATASPEPSGLGDGSPLGTLGQAGVLGQHAAGVAGLGHLPGHAAALELVGGDERSMRGWTRR